MSLICGALAWLAAYEHRDTEATLKICDAAAVAADGVGENDGAVCADDEPDWVKACEIVCISPSVVIHI
jgi:hypothetical protein